MKGEHMDNFILTLKDICVTETQVYTEQHQVPEDRKEEGKIDGTKKRRWAKRWNQTKKMERRWEIR